MEGCKGVRKHFYVLNKYFKFKFVLKTFELFISPGVHWATKYCIRYFEETSKKF